MKVKWSSCSHRMKAAVSSTVSSSTFLGGDVSSSSAMAAALSRIAGQSSTQARTSASTARSPSSMLCSTSGAVCSSISTCMKDSRGSSCGSTVSDGKSLATPFLSRRTPKMGCTTRCTVSI